MSVDDNNDDDRSGYLLKHFNPTDEHSQLRDMVKTFVEREVRSELTKYSICSSSITTYKFENIVFNSILFSNFHTTRNYIYD